MTLHQLHGICGAERPRSMMLCTRRQHHEGPHRADGAEGEPLAEWNALIVCPGCDGAGDSYREDPDGLTVLCGLCTGTGNITLDDGARMPRTMQAAVSRRMRRYAQFPSDHNHDSLIRAVRDLYHARRFALEGQR